MGSHASVLRRHVPFALAVLSLVAVSMVSLSAAGVAPAPVVNFMDAVVWIITFLLCPTVGLWLAFSGITSLAEGHHGASTGAAIKVACAVCLFAITAIVDWLHF